MSAQPATPDDQLNQYLIDLCFEKMMAAPTTGEQKRWFERMGYYVGRRSPERIQEMEIAKGLV